MSLMRTTRFLNLLKGHRVPLTSGCQLVESNAFKVLHSHKRTFFCNVKRPISASIVQTQELPEVEQFDNNTDKIFQQCEGTQRKYGYVQRRQVTLLHETVVKNKTVTAGQSLFLLRCCGNLANMENVEWRQTMTLKVMDTFEKVGLELDISHYNMLLKVNIDNGVELNFEEFLESLKGKDIQPNRVTYARLIEGCCQRGDIEGSNKILELMKENSLPLNEDIFNSLILGNAKTGDLQGALAIVDTMKEADLNPGPRTCAILLQAYAENGDTDGLFKHISENEDNLYSAKAFIDVIPILARKGLNEHIQKIIDRLEGFDRWSNSANGTIVKLSTDGYFEVALQLMMATTGRSGSRFNFFLEDVAESGTTIDKVLHICKEMRGRNICEMSYEVVLKHLLSKGEMDTAVKVLREMDSLNIPIRPHYIYPFFSFQNELTFDKVFSMLEELLELNIPIDQFLITTYIIPQLPMNNVEEVSDSYIRLVDMRGQQTIRNFYNGIIEYMLKEKKYVILTNFVGRFKRGINNTITKEKLMSDMLVEANPKLSMQVFKQFLPISVRLPDEREKTEEDNQQVARLFGGIIKILCRTAQTLQSDSNPNVFEKKFMSILEVMKEERFPIGYSENKDQLVKFIGEDNCSPEMLEILDHLSNPDLRPMESNYGQSDARQMQNKMKKLQESGEEIPHGLQIKLLRTYARKVEVEKAEDLIEKLQAIDPKLTPLVNMQLAQMYLHADRLQDAEKYINIFLEEKPDFILSPVIVLNYAAGLATAGRIDDAIKAVLLCSPASGEWGDIEHSVKAMKEGLDDILKAFSEHGDATSIQRMQEALLLRKFPAGNHAYSLIVDYHIQKGELPEALKQFEQIAREHEVLPSRKKLCCAFIEKDDIDQLQQVVNISAKIYGEMNTLYDLAFYFIETGRIGQAEKILKTSGLRTLHNKLDSQCKFFLRLGRMVELEHLVEITKNLLQVDRESLYMHLLNGYIREDNPEKAVEVWTKMQDEGIGSTDEFLSRLGGYLTSKGLQAPFKIPKLEYNDNQLETPRSFGDYGRGEGRLSTPRTQRIRNEQQEEFYTSMKGMKMEGILRSEEREDFLSKVKNDIVNGVELPTRFMRVFIQTLGKSGDLTTLLFLQKYLNEEQQYQVRYESTLASVYLDSGRSEEYLTNLLETISEATKQDFTIPASPILSMVKKDPEMLPLYEKCAEAYNSKFGPYIHSILFDFYFSTDETEKANTLYEKHLKECDKLCIRQSNSACLKTNDTEKVKTFKEIIKKKINGREVLLAITEMTHISILLKENKVQEAVDVFDESLKNVKIEHFQRGSLAKLQKMAVESNVNFAHTLPVISKPSSSSSSDSD